MNKDEYSYCPPPPPCQAGMSLKARQTVKRNKAGLMLCFLRAENANARVKGTSINPLTYADRKCNMQDFAVCIATLTSRFFQQLPFDNTKGK